QLPRVAIASDPDINRLVPLALTGMACTELRNSYTTMEATFDGHDSDSIHGSGSGAAAAGCLLAGRDDVPLFPGARRNPRGGLPRAPAGPHHPASNTASNRRGRSVPVHYTSHAQADRSL